jgi:asparagine synthase (glutamine-hydrolysing)
LPDEIVNRRKVGFEMPLGEWLRPRGRLAHRVQSLREAGSFAARVTNRNVIEQLINEHNAKTANHGDILWTLIALDTWARVFLDGRCAARDYLAQHTGKALELIGGAR